MLAEKTEQRAAATTTGDEPNTERPVIGQLFPQGAAAFCGVSIETVGAGETIYPVLSTGATVHEPGESTAATESTAAFTIETLTPKRLQASFAYTVEAAVFATMPDALRQNLNDALQNELDKKILVRTSDGLLDFGTDPDTPASASNYAAYSDAMFEAVDGLYANMIGDTRMLVGSSIYAHMGKTYCNANAPDSGLEVLARQYGGWDQGQAPSGEWTPRRLGANPPPTLPTLGGDVEKTILAACGIPPEAVMGGQGTASREAFRRFLHLTISPSADVLGAQLEHLTDDPVKFKYDRLMASDIQGRARAFQSMVGGGMNIGRAAALSGLLAVDDEE